MTDETHQDDAATPPAPETPPPADADSPSPADAEAPTPPAAEAEPAAEPAEPTAAEAEPAAASEEEADGEPKFADLGLAPHLLQAIADQGYETPTPIQAAAIPPLLAGRDLRGQAQTGTGKTAAFALPLLQNLDPARKGVQAIVLTPTRELALQVAEAVRAYGRHLGDYGVRVLPVYGGQPMPIQLRALRRGVHVVIGTPGRVKDHLERGTLDLSKVGFFGLDEADEMLKMGFIDDVEWILEHAPAERQIALFSATLPERIRNIAERYLGDAVDIEIAHKTLTVPSIEQLHLRVLRREKDEMLERLLEAEEYEAVLVFTRTQRMTSELAERLQAHGLQAEAMHGGVSQAQREAIVRRLRARGTEIVVATDVAARGLDVDHIDLVINYDIPQDEEVFVHRIGRTGRAGRKGRAITLWQPRERRMLHSIERYTGQRMKALRIPGPAELLDRKRERFVDQVRELAREGEEEFLELVDGLAAEDGLDLRQVAAAAARVAWGEGPLVLEAEPEPEPEPELPAKRKKERKRDGERGPRGPRSDETELVLSIGHRDRIRPGDVVGAITGEADLSGDEIGKIRILDRVTFVAVPAAKADAVLEALTDATIRGCDVRPRLAHPEGGDDGPRGGGGPRGSYGGRDDRPRGSYGGRDDRPRGSYGGRDDRPRGSYGGRDDRPRRPWRDRDDRPRGRGGDDRRPPRRDRDDRPGGRDRDGDDRRYDNRRPPRRDRDDRPRGPRRDDDRQAPKGGGERDDRNYGDRGAGNKRFDRGPKKKWRDAKPGRKGPPKKRWKPSS